MTRTAAPAVWAAAAAAVAVAALGIAPPRGARADVPNLTPQLVKDIDPTNANSNVNNLLGVATAVGDIFYFRFSDGSTGDGHGVELWRTDGTAAGTWMVKDIRTGTPNGFPQALVNLGNGRMIFNATTGTTQFGAGGAEPWVSDGTDAGTFQLKDIFPGTGNSNPGAFVKSGDTVFFRATAPDTLDELWKTDGTTAGTMLVKDIHPGHSLGGTGTSNFGSNPTEINAISGGRVLFAADDFFTPNQPGGSIGTFDRELWVSDGTTAGTVRVAEINPGGATAAPSNLRRFNGDTILFTATGPSGRELYRSDGTAAGTSLVKDINPGTTASAPGAVFMNNGVGFFSANDGSHGTELWRTDGTEAGTQLVKDINPGTANASVGNSIASYHDRVWFTANDGTHGSELWSTDGTETGTEMFRDFVVGTGNSTPLSLTVFNDLLFFVTIAPIPGDSNVTGTLWATDGTLDGTVTVAQTPGPANGYGFFDLNVVGNTLYFIASNGLDTNGRSANYELFSITVPEPTGVAAAMLGLSGLAALRRRR
jgi:ELWxxDGT repeat protein